ncbi:MAG TPA: acyl-CoA dehydrogenase family protein [Candidatus Dormibacteraeota bacterium]|nr:acyl-CoA dehydrogenase family protein [Candidatus Dormibacteraeota bacterium]
MSIRELARRLAREVIRPSSAEYDRSRAVPKDVLERLHQTGLTTLAIPESLGGGGVTGALESALVAEELAWGCAGIYSYLSGTNMYVATVADSGTEDQKARWLRPLCAEKFAAAAFACTEPEAGSDVSGIKTVAKATEGGYLLRGQKTFITNAGLASAMAVLASTAPELGSSGLTMFLIRGDVPGLSCGPPIRMMGWRAAVNSDVFFDDVFVPTEDILGTIGAGNEIATRVFERSRIDVAAASLGITRAALEYAVDYANTRVAFGKKIRSYQGLSFPLADVATSLRAARLLTWDSARACDRGEDFGVLASMAKLFASETAIRATYQAIQVLGGHGYTEEHPVEKWYRDARLETIEEGTSEIQRLIISRALHRGELDLS